MLFPGFRCAKILWRPIAAVIPLVLLSVIIHPAYAQEEPVEYNEDYDFSWLDPDKKVYVVQNRKYLKGRKIELMLGAGINASGAYTSSNVFMGRATYFFNEQFGASVVAGVQTNSRNDTYQELETTTNVLPNVRDVTSFFGGSVMWVPFYGKYNLFNKIFYIDWHLELGIASVSTEVDRNFTPNAAANIATSSHSGFYWGTGMKFFINRTFSARLDMLALYYSAPLFRQGAATSENQTEDNYYLTLGLSAHL